MIDNKSSKTIINIFLFFIPFLSLYNMKGAIRYVGFFSVMFILLMSTLLLISYILNKKSTSKNKIGIILTYIAIIILMSLGTLFNNSFRAVIRLIQLILIVNFFLLFSIIRYNENTFNYRRIFACLSIYISIYYITMIKDINNLTNFKSIYANPNTLGIFSFLYFVLCLVIYHFNSRFISIMCSFLFALMVFLSGSRTNLIALIIFGGINVFYKVISKNKFIWNTFILLVCIFIIAFTCIYPNLDKFSFYDSLSRITFNLTGKNLYSGRNILWRSTIELIKQKPFWGYGTGIQLSDFIDVGLSAHNLYIQITLQNGIIGLCIFIIFIILIWNLLYCTIKDGLIKLGASFFVSALILNVFEITLIQNNLSAAIIQWFIISMGVSKSMEYKRLSKLNKDKPIE